MHVNYCQRSRIHNIPSCDVLKRVSFPRLYMHIMLCKRGKISHSSSCVLLRTPARIGGKSHGVCLNVAGRDSRVEVAGAGAGKRRGCG